MTESIEADNAVIEGIAGVTFGIHLCRGNVRSMWHREGGYDAIAERLFNGLKHDRFLLEYDTKRAGTFEPLRFVPKDKIVVLGLVSSKVPELESTDETQETHRRSQPLYSPGATRPEPPVRLFIKHRRQFTWRRGPMAQT